MLTRFAAFLIVASAFICLEGSLTALAQQEKKKEVVILSPKAAVKVGQMEEVQGQLNVKDGWPVVLVKPLVSGEPWYVQGAVDEVAKGKFTAKVQFGDDDTKEGTKFSIVIIVAKNQEEAAKFEAGMERKELPSGLPRSEYVEVVLAK